MKKILIVTPFFIPAYSYGGIVKVAYDHAIGLVKKGFNVTVITTDVHDSMSRNGVLSETIDGIKIIRFKNLSNHLAKFHNLHLPLGMKKWIKNNIKNYDIIHIHDIYTLSTYWACKYALENEKKYFIQPHGTLSTIMIDSRMTFIKNGILRHLKKYFNLAEGFFALTKVEIENIKKISTNNSIYELPNGIDIHKTGIIKKINLQELFHLSNDVKIITFLGRIQYIKGLDISFDILAKLDKKFKNWRFLIIGPDEGEKKDLIELSQTLGISEKIIWYGIEDTSKKYELLNGSDVFLLNSRSEGFGLSIIESCISELPIVISNNCPIRDITDYSIGYCLDNAQIDDFVDGIIKILNNKESYKINLRKYVLDNYEIDEIISRLIKFYEKSTCNP